MKRNVFLISITFIFSAICILARPSSRPYIDVVIHRTNGTKSGEVKVLVLIIASDDQPVYPELQKIWRTYMHNDPEHIEAYFIRGNPDLPFMYTIDGDTLWLRTAENIIPGIINKTILSLEALSPHIYRKFDYVLRTNLSSFYVFPRLLEFLKKCPRKKFYCGSDIGINRNIASGSGFILSHDLAKLLITNKRYFVNNQSSYDDVLIGEFMCKQKIPLTIHQRTDFFTLQSWYDQKDNLDGFQFRVKNENHLRLSDDVYIQTQLLHRFYPQD